MKSIYTALQKTNISLTSHRIFCQFERQNNAIGSDRALSLHEKEVHFKTRVSLAVFSKTTEVEFVEKKALSRRRHEHNHQEQECRSAE